MGAKIRRKPIIGVMGGDRTVGAQESDAKSIGALLTEAQTIVLSGGRCVAEMGVKNAVMLGAEASSQTQCPARLIGILPSDPPREWDETQDRRLFLWTGLKHKERDAINGVTPDALIFFAGSSGTLCELAFAVQAKKPILFWHAKQTLRRKFEEHTEDRELDKFLASALAACKEKLGPVLGVKHDTSIASLRESLRRELDSAADFRGGIRELIAEAIRQAHEPADQSGFPGFREEQHSRERFETIVMRISV